MTLRETSNRWTPRFVQTLYPRDPSSAQMEIELLLSYFLRKDRIWIVAHDDAELTAGQLRKFEGLARRRLEHEPMAYLLGHREFYGRDFLTDKRALIPRPETELLIDLTLNILKNVRMKTLVWDVGTGCGAIAVTVAKEEPKTTVVASDVDRGALTLARKNALKHDATVKFICDDLLGLSVQSALSSSPAMHLLVLANLPYLPLSDQKKLEPDVTKYEPATALFTKENGLFLISKLLHQLSGFRTKARLPKLLNVLIEFDPPQSKVLIDLAAATFPGAHVKIHQDLCGRDRVLEIVN